MIARAVVLVLALLVPTTPALAQRGGPRGGGRPLDGAGTRPDGTPTDGAGTRPDGTPTDGAGTRPDGTPAPGVSSGKTYGFEIPDILGAMNRGEARQAMVFYESAAKDAERRGAPIQAAQAYTALAYAAMGAGAYQKCIVAGLHGVDALKALPTSEATSVLAVNLLLPFGNCYRFVGDHASARRRYEEGLQAAAGVPPQGRSVRLGLVFNAIAQTAFEQGDYDEAIRNAREGATELEKMVNMGAGGASREAMARMAAGKDAARRHLARSYFTIGLTELARRHPDEAEAAFKDSLTYAKLGGQHDQEAQARGGFGRVALLRNDAAAAVRHFQDAIALAKKVDAVAFLVNFQEGLARAHAAAGHTDKALEAVHQSIRLIEGLRGGLEDPALRTSFLEDKQSVYQLGVRFALAGQRTEEAFGFAESSRARAFLDLLGNQTTLSKGKTRALVDEEVKLRSQLAAAQTEAGEDGDERRGRRAVEAAQKAYQAFLERVRKENLEQASLMSVDPVTIKEIQGLLPEGATLLEYLVADTELVVWVIDRARAAVVRVPARREELVADVRAFRAGIAAVAPLDELQPRARSLYDRLVARVRPEVRGDRLIIVPHDALHYLPFAALRSADGRWLVEDYTISTLPSASVLKFLQGKGAGASDRVFAIGNPDLGPALALRWAEREARMVGQRFPSSTVLVRDQATEAQAKTLAPQAGLIHFALHGELNEQDPLSSALLLVPGADDDGRLEVREIFAMELSARLVVLSACETGLGKLSRGDELVGLQRAFLYAGTPAVVTTLWRVDDRASFELVRAFYAELATRDAAQALRGAQRAVMPQ
ncbi:MAG: CHAT domain-containing protein, partial [Candidatus Rokubacteria bacterium]|nr:CHAT domain-containing protein [Candidatus Rokubacteria bacterium]